MNIKIGNMYKVGDQLVLCLKKAKDHIVGLWVSGSKIVKVRKENISE